MEKLLKVEEVRDRLGLQTVHTVYRWARAGKLPVVALSARTWRFREEDVEAFIAEHRKGASV